MNKVHVGVYGASGYAGMDLIDILVRHPNVEIIFATSSTFAKQPVPGTTLSYIPHDEAKWDGIDAVFLALPHGVSGQKAAEAHAAGVKVIDLSADLRLDTPEAYEQWYGHTHPHPELLTAPYGLPEINREQIKGKDVVAAPGWSTLPRDLVAEVADELNVVEMVELAGAVGGELVDVSVKIDFRAVGRRLGKQVQAVATAVAAADPAALTAAYRAGTATVEVDGSPVTLEEGDLVVTETPREGWTVASGGGLTVALDLTLTPELERAGLVREVVRLIQEARKNSGLEVSDRIELWWTADGAIGQALTEQGEQVAGEVLASAVHAGTAGEGAGNASSSARWRWKRPRSAGCRTRSRSSRSSPTASPASSS